MLANNSSVHWALLTEQFRKRPRNVLYLINEVFATGVIYPTVLAGWMFLTLAFSQPQTDQPPATGAALTAAIWVFVVGFLITLIYNLELPHHEKIYNFYPEIFVHDGFSVCVRREADY